MSRLSEAPGRGDPRGVAESIRTPPRFALDLEMLVWRRQ